MRRGGTIHDTASVRIGLGAKGRNEHRAEPGIRGRSVIRSAAKQTSVSRTLATMAGGVGRLPRARVFAPGIDGTYLALNERIEMAKEHRLVSFRGNGT